MIRKNSSIDEIREEAISQGMVPLFHDGLLKALNGETTMEEITRVAGDIDYVKLMFSKILDQTLTRGIYIDKNENALVAGSLKNLLIIEKKIADIKMEEAFDLVAALGLVYKASDIHIEPEEEKTIIRYRINGVLEDKLSLPKELHGLIIQHIKNLSGLDVKITDRVQEGRFKITEEGKGDRDCRVSIIPSGYGEAVVLRILESDIKTLSLTELGILPEFLPVVKKAITAPTGIIISCGPTSSGKTTTMYSILSLLNNPSIKIMTIEDPIEYRLTGVLQTQVKESSGYTFPEALRSFLRQNPNVILVGEIRDEETAKVAMQASLTGHLILSTLHTADTATVVSRLGNFQISNSEIATSLNMLLAQRLVRKLCPHCKKEENVSEFFKKEIKEEKEKLNKELGEQFGKYFDKEKVYTSVGCEECNFTGFLGQTGLFEILVMDEAFRKIIADGANINILREEVQKRALTLKQDGIIKTLMGIISETEVKRVLGEV